MTSWVVDCVENQCQVTISVDNWPITRSRPLWTRTSSIDLFGRAATEIRRELGVNPRGGGEQRIEEPMRPGGLFQKPALSLSQFNTVRFQYSRAGPSQLRGAVLI